jgi:hypothetical protein
MENISPIPRDKVLLLISRELINNRVNRAVPEVTPISLSQIRNLMRSAFGIPEVLKFVGIRRVMK